MFCVIILYLSDETRVTKQFIVNPERQISKKLRKLLRRSRRKKYFLFVFSFAPNVYTLPITHLTTAAAIPYPNLLFIYAFIYGRNWSLQPLRADYDQVSHTYSLNSTPNNRIFFKKLLMNFLFFLFSDFLPEICCEEVA